MYGKKQLKQLWSTVAAIEEQCLNTMPAGLFGCDAIVIQMCDILDMPLFGLFG